MPSWKIRVCVFRTQPTQLPHTDTREDGVGSGESVFVKDTHQEVQMLVQTWIYTSLFRLTSMDV